jgi:hypothetical protein
LVVLFHNSLAFVPNIFRILWSLRMEAPWEVPVSVDTLAKNNTGKTAVILSRVQGRRH